MFFEGLPPRPTGTPPIFLVGTQGGRGLKSGLFPYAVL